MKPTDYTNEEAIKVWDYTDYTDYTDKEHEKLALEVWDFVEELYNVVREDDDEDIENSQHVEFWTKELASKERAEYWWTKFYKACVDLLFDDDDIENWPLPAVWGGVQALGSRNIFLDDIVANSKYCNWNNDW